MTEPAGARGSIAAGQTFEQYVAERNIVGARMAALLAIFLMPGGVLLDWVSQPAKVGEFLVLRLGASALGVVILGLSYVERVKRHDVLLGAGPIFTAALAIELMIERLDSYRSPYYAGLNLCMLGLGLLFTWRARQTAVACGLIVAMWAAPALARHSSLEIGTFFNNAYFLVLTGVIAVASNFLRYGLARREFEARHGLAAASQELTGALERLQQLDRWKSQFFANVTHELRTPLTMILAPLESILSGDFGPLTAVQRSYLEANWRNGVRLLKLINDLLDLAKLGEGFLKLRLERANVVSLLEEIVSYSRPLAARKALQLELEVTGKPGELYVDVEKLERVIVNLISNALKFTESGKVTISVDSDGQETHLTVSDTGIGIPEPAMAHLFERFSQGDASVTRRFGGTGLGLAYAREIVELHGGSISVCSEPGQGSKFTVHLKEGEAGVPVGARDRRVGAGSANHPKRREDQEPMEWALRLQRQLDYRFAEIDQVTDRRVVSRAAGSPATSGRILVVEDNVEILELINLQLRDKYSVHVAQDGRQGLETAKRERPDVIVTDFMMPEMDGLQMLRAIRDEPGLTDTPVIMLTAKNQLDDRLSARQAGADVYLEKPFSPRELEAAITQLLQKQGRQMMNLMRAHVEGLEIVSAGLAHEIHNPLNFIKNANLLIAENVGKLQETLAGLTEVPPERTGDIEKIRGRIDKMVQSSTRGVERIEKVVDLIRRYAREGYPTETSEVDFDLAVVEVTELVAPRADMEGRVTEQLGAPGRVVRAIPEELNQVIRCLVQNACESVGPTGKVHVSTRVDGAHVVLEVTDNGPGITPENVAKIFSPFFTTKPGSGRGMGLAIVQIVINRIGGTVEVTSTPGVQTAFRVRLPATEATVQLQAQAAPAGSPAAPLN